MHFKVMILNLKLHKHKVLIQTCCYKNNIDLAKPTSRAAQFLP